MGSDKALLPFHGRTLVEHVAFQVQQAVGSITLVGDPARYSYLGYPVIADTFAGCGPLSGIHAALAASPAEWNLIVACDMPDVTAEFLSRLLERAESSSAYAVLPVGPSGLPEPLCAAYSQRAVEAVEAALQRGIRKVLDGLASLQIDLWRVPDTGCFHNLNTPQEWACYYHD